jgi:hypothetical protein
MTERSEIWAAFSPEVVKARHRLRRYVSYGRRCCCCSFVDIIIIIIIIIVTIFRPFEDTFSYTF